MNWGVLKQGFIIGNASEGVVEVQKITFCKDEDEQPILGSFQCPKVEKTDEHVVIQSIDVADKVSLVHDCKNGGCFFSESENTVRIEREAVAKEIYTYVHNMDYKYFLLNKFYLGESLKYFNVA